ncbi:TonB-dependent receptor plug domain-containing protein [Microbulbifer sp. SA54]|uniref:TonB-dependent receptor plug domain-containing protein n=1 Tax=Microbulbifer sp. SA54 TaxID=3401577 RepID=UPI003AAA364C
MKKNLLASAIVASASAFVQTATAESTVTSVDQTLEQVVVTASRVEIPRAQTAVSVSVLTAVDIEKLGYATLMDVVKTLPGISVSNNGGLGKVSNIYVRGESGSRTLVLLDGVNVADPTNTQVTTQFQHLLASDVERIEVLRGPQGMMYGAGAGGVINIITKRAQKPLELQLSAETGRYNTNRNQVALRGEQAGWNYKLNLSQLDSDGFNARETDSSGERDGYDNRTTSASLGYAFSEQFSVEGQVRQIDADTEFDGCSVGWNPSDDCEGQYQQKTYQLTAKLNTDGVEHRVTISSQQLERDSLVEGASSNAVAGRIDEWNYSGNWNLDSGAISWGADLDEQEYEQEYEPLDKPESVDLVGLYAEWRGEMAEKVFYMIGYRHDRLEDDDHDSWRISAAVPHLIGDNQKIKYRASASTGFRSPSPFEMTTNLDGGVAPVGPETSRGFELGLEYSFAELLQLELVAFRQTVSDAIVYVSGLGSGWGAYAQDDGESDSEGYELYLSGKFTDSARWYANGTWLDSTDSAGEQRLNVAQEVYNLGVNYSLLDERLSLAGNWRYVADRDSLNPVWGEPALALDSYNRLDLNAKYDFSDRIAFTLRGENLLDEGYREVAGFNTAGAAIYAGVQFSLD